jgi:cbb3-type cytochrome oxidase subunit 3
MEDPMPSFNPDPQWIAAAVETPFMAVLAWMLHSLRRSIVQNEAPLPEREAADHAQQQAALERTRDDLAAFKLEVARTYVPLSLIRDVDGRLTAHLIRIEQKLDEATRAAHSTAAQMRVLAEDR